MQTTYERCGGFTTVRKVVSDFYDRVLDEDRLAGHFTDVDMARLIDHQTKFISFLLDGPASFSDDHLERVHSHLQITLPEFDLMTTVLRETLADHGFGEADIAVVDQRLRQRESIIVTVR
jgi:hemoglobin